MTTTQTARLASVIAAAAGWLALLGSPLSIVWQVLLGLALLVGPIAAARGRGGSPRLWTGLTVVAIIIAPFSYFLITNNPVLTGAHLVIFLQINRLFQLRTHRESRQVVLLGLLTLMLASVLTLSMWFLFALMIYTVSASWALAVGGLASDEAFKTKRVPKGLRGSLTGAGLAMFVLTLLLFVILPRIRFQTFRGTVASSVGVVGFSDSVSLGDIGAIKQDRTPVMRVTLDGDDDVSFLWRGHALDRYEDGSWSVSDVLESEVNYSRSTPGKRIFRLPGNESVPLASNQVVKQDIVLEPLAENVLFGLPKIVAIDGPIPALTIGTNESIFFQGRGGRINYTVFSVEPTPPARTEPVALNPDLLQVPSELREELSAIATEAFGDAQTPRDRADALVGYFQSGFTYTLQPPAPDGDPVLHFLTEGRAGYCEHYASAMTLLARSAGLPARVATGFGGGELNELGDYYLIRQSDAHAWVEIEFADSGWVAFDPTPPAPPERPFLHRARRFVDYVRMLWLQRVTEYDMLDQFRILRSAGSQASQLRLRMAGWLRSLRPTTAALFGVGLGLVGLGLWWIWTRPRRRKRIRRSAEFSAAVRVWQAVLRRLAKRGVRPQIGETPRQLAARADYEGLEEIAEIYYRARFSKSPINAGEINRMQRLADDLHRREPPSALS